MEFIKNAVKQALNRQPFTGWTEEVSEYENEAGLFYLDRLCALMDYHNFICFKIAQAEKYIAQLETWIVGSSIAEDFSYVFLFKTPTYSCNYTLEQLFQTASEYEESADQVKTAIDGITDNYRYIRSFRLVVETLISFYGIKEFSTLLPDDEGVLSSAKNLEKNFKNLHTRIKTGAYIDHKVQKEKLKVIEKHFFPLHVKELYFSKPYKYKLLRYLKELECLGPVNVWNFLKETTGGLTDGE